VNLRGVIVPIMDLRLKFNLDLANYDGTAVVIVLKIGKRVIGMAVDAVSEVITLALAQTRTAPEFGSGVESNYVLAIGTVEDRMLVLIDIEKFMSSADIGLCELTLQ